MMPLKMTKIKFKWTYWNFSILRGYVWALKVILSIEESSLLWAKCMGNWNTGHLVLRIIKSYYPRVGRNWCLENWKLFTGQACSSQRVILNLFLLLKHMKQYLCTYFYICIISSNTRESKRNKKIKRIVHSVFNLGEFLF